MTASPTSLITKQRKEFHTQLIQSGVMAFCGPNAEGSNSDGNNRLSVDISNRMLGKVGGVKTRPQKLGANTVGMHFEVACRDFLAATFLELSLLRPGSWKVLRVGSDITKAEVRETEQFEHLAMLDNLAASNAQIKAALGTDYVVAPDVVVFRDPETDQFLNSEKMIVDEHSALHTPIRLSYRGKQLMHACVSCKWTMRSDRAQNTRTEALNLIRNRKGRAPHIVSVTGEPLPSRVSSLALGTGDIDCVYHVALYELVDAVRETNNDEADALISAMVDGRRLKDISDLPFDLAI